MSIIDQLFDRFSLLYGARMANMWEGLNPDRIKQAWRQELAEFDADIIVRAAGMLKEKEKVFPPTLPEFAALCRQTKGLKEPYHSAHQPAPKLPAPDNSKATAEAKARCMATARSLGMLKAIQTIAGEAA